MGFGDSMRAAEDGRVERYCCNVICGAPTTSKVKGLEMRLVLRGRAWPVQVPVYVSGT